MKLLITLLFAILFISLSCTSSRITSSWQKPGQSPQAYHKIVVFGLMKDKDRAIREKMENHLVGDLKSMGYKAFSSLQEYGPKAFEQMNETQVNEQLKKDNVDAVLTIVLLDKEKERYYVPGRVVFTPYVFYQHRFWGYYVTMHNRIATPGYYDTNTRYFWESNFYDLRSNELLYSVQTESFNPSSVESLAHEYGKMIVQNMQKKGVLQIQSENGHVPF